MIRTQISLTEEEMDDLRKLARHRHVSMAVLVREAVGRLLAEAGDGEGQARAVAASGRFSWSGAGRDHDADLLEAFAG